VYSLIPYSQSDMKGWQYSLDTIIVQLDKSTVKKARFAGKINVPINKETETFSYSAIIQPDIGYQFTVTAKSKMSFPLWGCGNVDIDKNSYVKIDIDAKTEEFVPEAMLNGGLDLKIGLGSKDKDNDTKDEGKNLSLLSIKFQKLKVAASKPYVQIASGGSFSVGSPGLEQKMAKLPLSITEIGFLSDTTDNSIGLRCSLRVNLTGSKDTENGFAAGARVVVWGYREEVKNSSFGKYDANDKNSANSIAASSWKFKKVQLERLDVDVSVSNIKLKGWIEFFKDDPTFGSGFAGEIDLKVLMNSSDPSKYIGGNAKAMFGKKALSGNSSDIFRYWMVDIRVDFTSTPIALFPPVLSINAIGGGVTYRMKLTDEIPPNPKIVTKTGMAYIPSEDHGLGVKAMLGIQAQSPKVYNGELMLEILFQKGGGLDNIKFSGFVKVASGAMDNVANKINGKVKEMASKAKSLNPLDKLTPDKAADKKTVGNELTNQGGGVLAEWLILYDNINHVFQATFDVHVNFANTIVGVNEGNHAGTIDILFTKTKWHVFVGKPSKALGAKLVLFGKDLAKTESYFMVGHDLEPPKILYPGGPDPAANFKNSAGELQTGKGLGLGARFEIGAADNWGWLYYDIKAGAGFDVMIWDVTGQKCNGQEKGIKGWYGLGQAAAYLSGKGGVKTPGFTVPYPCRCGCHCDRRCWRPWCWGCDWCKDRIEIDLSVSIFRGIGIYAEGPNPTFVEGTMDIKGHEVKVRFGKRC
jgi:hypothetical protein